MKNTNQRIIHHFYSTYLFIFPVVASLCQYALVVAKLFPLAACCRTQLSIVVPDREILPGQFGHVVACAASACRS